MGQPMADRYSVPQAAHSELYAGERCNLTDVRSSEPHRDAQAIRIGNTIVVTADVTVTYVYQAYEDDNETDE